MMRTLGAPRCTRTAAGNGASKLADPLGTTRPLDGRRPAGVWHHDHGFTPQSARPRHTPSRWLDHRSASAALRGSADRLPAAVQMLSAPGTRARRRPRRLPQAVESGQARVPLATYASATLSSPLASANARALILTPRRRPFGAPTAPVAVLLASALSPSCGARSDPPSISAPHLAPG
jgi:hypothetical protein